MNKYFNINYEFSQETIHCRIADQIKSGGSSYLCVADGNILQYVHKDLSYLDVVNGGMFSICDSSWVPLFLRLIYGIKVKQYCGSQIFEDLISSKKYRMMFLGTSKATLQSLKNNLSALYGSNISQMSFCELPFCRVEDFDFDSIAKLINDVNPDIIWLSLGAPKQEIFASKLVSYLNRGVIIPVGAVFNFYSGYEKRAPKWMIKAHLEFIYRIFQSPIKQVKRCFMILLSLPSILIEEIMLKHKSKRN